MTDDVCLELLYALLVENNFALHAAHGLAPKREGPETYCARFEGGGEGAELVDVIHIEAFHDVVWVVKDEPCYGARVRHAVAQS